MVIMYQICTKKDICSAKFAHLEIKFQKHVKLERLRIKFIYFKTINTCKYDKHYIDQIVKKLG